ANRSKAGPSTTRRDHPVQLRRERQRVPRFRHAPREAGTVPGSELTSGTDRPGWHHEPVKAVAAAQVAVAVVPAAAKAARTPALAAAESSQSESAAGPGQC